MAKQKSLKGIVIKSTGKWYSVRVESGEVVSCRIKGKFRLEGIKTTNPIAVGDFVEGDIEEGEEGTGIINKILPRKNYVARVSPRKKHFMHLIASNIDQAMIITTIRNPDLKPAFIDRFILLTESHNIPTYIVYNKSDLYSEEDIMLFNGLKRLYGKIGYESLLVSAETGEGVEAIRDVLKDKTTLISGHSGVGKSTLTNAVNPGLNLKTSEISDYTGKGTHTTTFAEMHQLAFGGNLIDTPGIKELGYNHMEPQDVAHNYKEFFELSHECRFSNCLHINEPHCAIKNGLETGAISELRYRSYLSIMEEIQAQNYWERKEF